MTLSCLLCFCQQESTIVSLYRSGVRSSRFISCEPTLNFLGKEFFCPIGKASLANDPLDPLIRRDKGAHPRGIPFKGTIGLPPQLPKFFSCSEINRDNDRQYCKFSVIAPATTDGWLFIRAIDRSIIRCRLRKHPHAANLTACVLRHRL